MTKAKAGGDRILRSKEVCTRLGIGRTTFYEWQKPESDQYDANFPKPITLGERAKGYLESEVNAYIQQLAERRAQTQSKSAEARMPTAKAKAMQCETDKRNPRIWREAMEYYLQAERKLRTRQNTVKPRLKPFTFISLWNDNEPYPLAELIVVLDDYITEQEAEAGAEFSLRNESLKINVINMQQNRQKLHALAEATTENTED